jgi:hypothetical protein
MKVFTKKVISILITLLTLFSLTPSFALADNQSIPPSTDSGESVDQMKSRMTESLNTTIETLENSKENLTNESSIEAAEKLTTNLEAIKKKISNAETQDDLLQIKQELDALFAAAPNDIKIILPPNIHLGPGMQNGSEKLFQGFENGTEKRPEIMINRTQPPRDGNVTMNNGMPGQGSKGIEEKGNLTNESGVETADEPSFFGKLFDALKSLFS